MFKNPTLKQIALYSSIIITFVYLAVSIFFERPYFLDKRFFSFLLAAFIVLISSYFIILYSVKLFVHDRIKLIYKSIHKAKLGADDKVKDNNLGYADDHAMDQVEKDVSQYVREKDLEIKSLRAMEDYRREFLGNISHELKTPIFNMQGYIHTLLEGGIYDENINIDYLRRAAKNTERLKVIVDDLTEISKLESGQLELEFEEFDIKALVEEVFKDQEFLAKEKSINLTFNDTANKAFRVLADKENIRQVLMNLITNAVKYNKKNGRVKASFYEMGQNVLVEIADNGYGIEEQHLPHLFDRFYRADAHRSRAIGGSGLGLSIVKHIIEAHKQTINVRSTPDVGTTFGFTLQIV